VVRAAHSFGAEVVSPVHGSPSGSTVADPSYRPYVTPAMVRSAHQLGMKVIPWTVDDEATMRAMVGDGVRRPHHELPGPAPPRPAGARAAAADPVAAR